MFGGTSSNSLIADTGDTYDLAVIIDRRCSSRAVASDQGQILDLIGRSEGPHGWTKLKDLRRNARFVMNAVLRPPNYLSKIVRSSGETIISTCKRGKSSHLVVLPDEPEIDRKSTRLNSSHRT